MSPKAPNTYYYNRSEFVPNTLPWLIGNRKQIGAADRPSAPTPEGGGVRLSPAPTGKRLLSLHRPPNWLPLVDLP